MNLREVIKERRSVLGISQIDLAEMAGISLAIEVLGLEMEFHIRSIK